jgi:hypothetical protein
VEHSFTEDFGPQRSMRSNRRTTMKTIILAAFAVFALSLGVSTMAQAATPNPWQGHTQNQNGQG